MNGRSTTHKFLSPHARSRFYAAHAWAGVVTSLVVYIMFALGGAVLFYRPLTVWEEPLLQARAAELASLDEPLSVVTNLPETFYYYLPHEGRGPAKLAYFLPGTTEWRMWWLDSAERRAIPQRELAAAYLYDLHYLWHSVTGYWLQYGGGVLVFAFLLAIATGVMIHLQTLLPELHRFRPQRTLRVAWSDLHKVTAVFGLPFQFVYATTGTLMALSPLLFELAVEHVFEGDVARAMDVAGALVEDPPPRDFGKVITPTSLETLAARARQLVPELEVESFVLQGYPREHGTVDVRGPLRGGSFGEVVVTLRLRDASLEHLRTPEQESRVGAIARLIHGLHTVEYGGVTARIFSLVLAFGTCLTILSGNWIWLARRQMRKSSRMNELLARLTTGVGAGTPLAVAALFFSSRVLPLASETRTRDELICMAFSFACAVIYALVSPRGSRVWSHLLAIAALGYLLLPLVSTRLSQRGLFGAGPSDPTVIAVELGFLLFGLVLATIAVVLARRMAPLRSPVQVAPE
jgi:uncharacterized iron-regulated membrane protein